VEDVDEDDFQHEIEHVRGDHDLQWAAQVRDAAQVALAGESDECRRQSEGRDPEVGEREVAGPAVPAEAVEQRDGDDLTGDEHEEADPERRPERLRRDPGGLVVPARSRSSRHDRRRPVGEEVEDREGAREHGAGEAERGDLRPA